MTHACPTQGCTVIATGICLLNFDSPTECPAFTNEASPDTDQIDPAAINPSVLVSPQTDNAEVDEIDAKPDDDTQLETASVVTNLDPPKLTKVRLSPGRELGLDGLARLASKRPIRLIGLLGAPDAGKTMALVSMFLLAARGMLDGYEYRNSESPFAFDDLSKGARAWSADGGMLEQIVSHTELANERRPGFLHLRLYASTIETAVDLAFPDLPGEWTDSLVNRDVYDRLAFLRNADAIWIFVDGEKLADLNFGHSICARTCSLIGRLAANLPTPMPLKLVVTRADQYEELPSAVLDPIKDEATDKGFELEVHEIISVDRAIETRSGEGISALLEASVAVVDFEAPPEGPLLRSSRHMLRYRAEMSE